MADASVEVEASPKGRKKTMVIVGGLLVLEAVLIVAFLKVFVGGAEATEPDMALVDPEMVAMEKIVELEVLHDKLANARTGVTYLYDTVLVAQTKQKYADAITGEFEQFHNEIKAEIVAIWRTSEPHHFEEPKLQSLTRKVQAMLHERFGTDEETGEPKIVKCVIVMKTGFRVDA